MFWEVSAPRGESTLRVRRSMAALQFGPAGFVRMAFTQPQSSSCTAQGRDRKASSRRSQPRSMDSRNLWRNCTPGRETVLENFHGVSRR